MSESKAQSVKALALLKQYYGYTTFRIGQEPLIQAILAGQDAMGIMPTGGGKSICYQMPALMLDGLTLVISPLISLMKDQVDALTENGISATFINSSITTFELNERLEGLKSGKYKLCYVAPERLSVFEFIEMTKKLDIPLIAVDEAHCISQWGHDFRPSYKEIPRFIDKLPKRPIVAAFTATATDQVKEEIKQLLSLKNPFEVVTGFDRPNLFYQVVKPQNKTKFVLEYLQQQSPDHSGIIFCSTRKTVESLTQELKKRGYAAEAYHAGFDSEERKRVQDAFMFDQTKIIVATNSFGMGIDKPDVRFVIHYNLPKNMEAYYQEAGRAGRDGEASTCILLYAPSDIVKQKIMIASNAEYSNADRDELSHANLQLLINYCHAYTCLRSEIMAYFGESSDVDNCGNCGNCTNTSEMVDMTVEAQKIMSCIYRTDQRYGSGTIIKILRGSKDKKLLEWGLDKQSTYGLMENASEGLIKEIIMHLVAQGYLDVEGGTYPILKLSRLSRPVLKGETPFFLRQDRVEATTVTKKDAKEKRSKKSKTPEGLLTDAQTALYEALSELRKKLATEKGIPTYMVFANATLAEMAEIQPRTKEEMLDIKGVGDKKYDTYGQIFLDEITAFRTGRED